MLRNNFTIDETIEEKIILHQTGSILMKKESKTDKNGFTQEVLKQNITPVKKPNPHANQDFSFGRLPKSV